VANPGLQVRSFRNTILLIAPNNDTTMLRYCNNNNKINLLMCLITAEKPIIVIQLKSLIRMFVNSKEPMKGKK
jgi:hypothetical protein